jgi:hypothetical protein
MSMSCSRSEGMVGGCVIRCSRMVGGTGKLCRSCGKVLSSSVGGTFEVRVAGSSSSSSGVLYYV